MLVHICRWYFRHLVPWPRKTDRISEPLQWTPQQDSLTQELEFLTTVFKDNGYSPQQIRRAMEPATRTAKTNDKPTSNAYIPYTQTTYGRLSRMLAKHDIKSVALQHRRIFSCLPPVKDALGLRTPSIYSIQCECGKVYFGQSSGPSKSESKIKTDI